MAVDRASVPAVRIEPPDVERAGAVRREVELACGSDGRIEILAGADGELLLIRSVDADSPEVLAPLRAAARVGDDSSVRTPGGRVLHARRLQKATRRMSLPVGDPDEAVARRAFILAREDDPLPVGR